MMLLKYYEYWTVVMCVRVSKLMVQSQEIKSGHRRLLSPLPKITQPRQSTTYILFSIVRAPSVSRRLASRRSRQVKWIQDAKHTAHHLHKATTPLHQAMEHHPLSPPVHHLPHTHHSHHNLQTDINLLHRIMGMDLDLGVWGHHRLLIRDYEYKIQELD